MMSEPVLAAFYSRFTGSLPPPLPPASVTPVVLSLHSFSPYDPEDTEWPEVE